MIDITDSELKQLSEYIHQKYGIYLKEQKRTLVTGRLSSVLEKHGFGSFSEYLSLIKNDPTGEEEKTLINQITTNYTYFMREPSHFSLFAGNGAAHPRNGGEGLRPANLERRLLER